MVNFDPKPTATLSNRLLGKSSDVGASGLQPSSGLACMTSQLSGGCLLSKYSVEMTRQTSDTGSLSSGGLLSTGMSGLATLHQDTIRLESSSTKVQAKVKSRGADQRLEQKLHSTQTGKTKKTYKEKSAQSKKLGRSVSQDREVILARFTITERPVYDIGKQLKVTQLEMPRFIPPEKDATIQKILRPVHDVQAMKVRVIHIK